MPLKLGTVSIKYMIDNQAATVQVSNTLVIIFAVVTLSVILAFYALRSIGVYTLAKRKGLKFAAMAWIPLLWLYVACRVVENTQVFGISMKKCALWFGLVFAIGGALSFTYDFIKWYPIIGYYMQGGTVTLVNAGAMIGLETGSNFINPFPSTASPIMVGIYIVSNVFSLLVLVITIAMYINLFKRYWPQHYILAAVFSFLGLFGPFVFAIRKKEPIKYSDYLRSRYGNMYYGGPYGNPYYGRNPDPNAPKPPETPFSEFAERGEKDPGDPFSEFDDDKKE